MAKKTKEQKMQFFDLEDEKNQKIKLKNKKQSKKKVNNKNNNGELFSFDHEIVIGVTKKEETKKNNKENNNKKVRNNSKNKNTKIKGKTKNKQTKQTVKNNKKKDNKKKKINNKQIERIRKISEEEQEKNLKNKKKIALFIKYGMLTVLLIIVILCAMFSPLFNIKTIQIEGNKKITEKEIVSLSQIQIDQNTFKLNKNKIKKQIKENSYIDEVVIIRKLPSTIILKIEERQPAYLLEYAGSYVYLDKKGYLLEINTEKLELPIMQGAVTPTVDFVEGNRLVNEDLEKLSTMAKIMELAKVNQIDNIITRIDIENSQNFKLIFDTKEKIVNLGDNSNMNTKILTIKAILEKEEGKAGEIFVNMDLNKENPVFRERV